MKIVDKKFWGAGENSPKKSDEKKKDQLPENSSSNNLNNVEYAIWIIVILVMSVIGLALFLYRKGRYKRLISGQMFGREKYLAYGGIIWSAFIIWGMTQAPSGPVAYATPTPVPVSQGNMLKVGVPFSYGDFAVTVTGASSSDTVYQNGISKVVARNGAKFITFSLAVTNNGKESKYFNIGADAYDTQGRKFDVAKGYPEDKRYFDNIEPGITANYVDYYIEVPSDVKQLTIEFWSTAFLSHDLLGKLELTGE